MLSFFIPKNVCHDFVSSPAFRCSISHCFYNHTPYQIYVNLCHEARSCRCEAHSCRHQARSCRYQARDVPRESRNVRHEAHRCRRKCRDVCHETRNFFSKDTVRPQAGSENHEVYSRFFIKKYSFLRDVLIQFTNPKSQTTTRNDYRDITRCHVHIAPLEFSTKDSYEF